MKRTRIFHLFALLFATISLSLALGSCKKEEVDKGVEQDEGAAVLENAFGVDAAGFGATLEQATAIGDLYNQGNRCDSTYDSVMTYVNTAGTRTWDYTNIWSWTVNCGQGVPYSIDLTYSMDGVYDFPVMSSADNAGFEGLLSQVWTNTDEYLLEGTYARTGEQTSKIGRKSVFTSELTIDFQDVLISKSTGLITSGLATFRLTGNDTKNIAFSYLGNITFAGNQTAVISINGTDYTVNWG